MRFTTKALGLLVLILISLGAIHGQTRSVTFSAPITVGWEGAIGSSNQRRAIVTEINRTPQQQGIVSSYLDAQGNFTTLHVRGSDGNEFDTSQVGDSISADKSSTVTLTKNAALANGSIRFQTTETFSARYNRFIANVAVQVVLQTVDTQGKVISSTASAPYGDTASVDTSFFTYARLSAHQQTSITLTNTGGQTATITLALYDLFSHALPYASATKALGPGQSMTGTLDMLFPGLPQTEPTSGGDGRVTDGNLDINADQFLTATASQFDDSVKTDLPVFMGRSTTPFSGTAPVLILEEGTDSAAAVDAQTFFRDPFPITTIPWFGGDGHTRILLFVQNVQLGTGESLSAIIVTANGTALTVEDIRAVANFPFSQLMVRLPDGLPSGTLSVTVTFHGLTSNAGKIRIK